MDQLLQFDRDLLIGIQHTLNADWLTPVMKVITYFGEGGCFWIALCLVLLWCKKTRRLGMVCAFSLLFCLVFPNGQDLRPAVFPRENVFTMLVARIYASDTNTNVLPSMHVIGSVAACIGAWYSRALRRWFPLVLVVAVLIILSTVFVKQHSILDIFAGLLVCLPLWWLIYGRKPRRKKTASDSQEVTK